MNRIREALERSSLNFKLGLAIVSMLLIVLAIGIQSLLVQRSLSEKVRLIHEQGMVGVSKVKDIQIYYTQIGRTIRQAILAPDPEGREVALNQLANAKAKIPKLIAELRPVILKEDQKQRLADFEAKFAQYMRDVDLAVTLAARGPAYQFEARALVGALSFQRAGQAANEFLEKLGRTIDESATLQVQDAQHEAAQGMSLSLAIIVGGLLLGLLFGVSVGSSIRRPLYRIRDAVQQISKGNFDHQLPHTGYPNEIGDLARAIALVQREAQQMENERWVKTHMAEIAGLLQQAQTFTDMAQLFLSSVGPLIKLGHGVFYIYEAEEKRLRLLGSYAFRERKNLEPYFALGQGLVGQCALEMVPMVFTDPPADYVRIGSSLGECVPRTLAVRPVLRNERLLGVLELASFDLPEARQEALLDGLMPILAMNLEILERSGKAQQLLKETQRQAESMEKQAAHLEEQTVELEAQQKSLKDTTAHLAVLEERSRLILDSVKDGIVGLDGQGVVSFSNPAGHAMLGFTAEEFVGHGMHALVHHHYADGGDFPGVECKMYLTTQDGQLRTVDDEVLWCKDGTAVPVEYSTTPVFRDGAIAGTVIVFRDITERRAAQEKLRLANFLSDQALDLTKAGHWHIPLNSGDEFYNSSERAATIFGDPPRADWRYHLMNEWFACVEAGDKAAATVTFENFNASLAGTVPRYDAVYAYKRPIDGCVIWIHAMGHVVRDANGTPTDMFGVTVDVTAAKLAEVELEERMDELERFHSLTIDREERMIALKVEINALLQSAGLAAKYKIVK